MRRQGPPPVLLLLPLLSFAEAGLTTQAEAESLVRDARALASLYEEEFVDTFLDGMIKMLRRLADVVEELLA